jgi:hypothetical protein
MAHAKTGATVFASRVKCSTGCGRTTNGNLVCAECSRRNCLDIEGRRLEERLQGLRRMAASGAPTEGTCLSCLNWRDQCLMGVPDVSVAFAPLCSCYLPNAR